MLDQDIRHAVFQLRELGHGVRAIARTLKISRNSVRSVIESGSEERPRIERAERLGEHLDRIRELHQDCKGNIVRVHEELGLQVPYSTLTAFCRRHGIGVEPKERAGRYEFVSGEEMQHDTSPHRVDVGGKERQLQCASLVLCYSRLLFAQCYPVWNRFHVKLFLTDALQYFGGAASRCMLDNSSVIIAHGTGKNAVPAAEMAAFSERFGFYFAAHELGDANRSARVERPFDFIERNFYPGRRFADVADLNRQLRTWCETQSRAHRSSLKASWSELFAAERVSLKPLPRYVPDVYDLFFRTVDVEGYVSLHRNRYSTPTELIGRQVEVREGKEKVRIFHGHRQVAVHERAEAHQEIRSTLPEHQRQPGVKARRSLPTREEVELRAAGEEIAALVDTIKKRQGGRAVRALRELHRLYLDYPEEALQKAAAEAARYGLWEVARIERMVLREIAGAFFRLGGRDDAEER